MDLLSICIPTYNRKERLKELLNKICCYNKNNIKIIVIDNASTDGTEKMMQSFSKFGNIMYFRNDSNIGHDGNYIRIIEEGKKVSKYSLWLGDDDCVTKDFFCDIPKLLIENKPDLLILNSHMYTNNLLKRCIKLFLNQKHSIWNLDCDMIETDFIKFYSRFYDRFAFGVLVVNNDMLNIDKSRKYFGTFHLYVGAIFEGLIDKIRANNLPKLYVTRKAYILWGKGNKTYSIDSKLEFGMGKFYAIVPDEIFNIAKNRIERQYKNGEITNNKWRGYIDNLIYRN